MKWMIDTCTMYIYSPIHFNKIFIFGLNADRLLVVALLSILWLAVVYCKLMSKVHTFNPVLFIVHGHCFNKLSAQILSNVMTFMSITHYNNHGIYINTHLYLPYLTMAYLSIMDCLRGPYTSITYWQLKVLNFYITYVFQYYYLNIEIFEKKILILKSYENFEFFWNLKFWKLWNFMKTEIFEKFWNWKFFLKILNFLEIWKFW
jgi:hypothetical protein